LIRFANFGLLRIIKQAFNIIERGRR